MNIVNGVRVYETGEKFELPDGCPPIPSGDKEARFGYLLEKTADGMKWSHASEADFRNSEKLCGTDPELLEADIKVRLLGGPLCDIGPGGGCVSTDSCGAYASCNGYNTNPGGPNNHFYCRCG